MERTLVMHQKVIQRRQAKPVRDFGNPGRTLLGRIGTLFAALLLLLCASSLKADQPLSLTFQLPLERAGHSFTLRQWMGEPGQSTLSTQPLTGGTITYLQDDGNGQMVATANSYLQLTGEVLSMYDYYLVDETTQQMTPVNVVGSDTFNRTSFLNTDWFANGTVSESFFLTLPESRFGHGFSLFADGVSYPLNTGPVLHYSTTDAQGNPILASYGFFEAWSPPFSPDVTGSYIIFDHSAEEQSDTLPKTNRSLLSAGWTPTNGSDIPTRMVRFWLPDSAGSDTFTLFASEGGVLMPNASPWYHTEYDASGNVVRAGQQISAVIGINQTIRLVRDQDDYQFPHESLGMENLSVDYTWLEPIPVWETFSFAVGENYFGSDVYVYQDDGSVIPAYPDYSSDVEYSIVYDSEGNEIYRFASMYYTAMVNTRVGYAVGDSSGPKDLMDGFNPPPPPPPPPDWQYIYFLVGENYFGSTITVDNNGTPVEAWEDTNVERGYYTTWDDYGQEVQFQYANYMAYVDVSQGYTIPDYMDGLQPWHPAPPQGSLTIQLANWRRNHTLKLRQADGTTWNVRLQPGYEYETYGCNRTATIFPGTPDQQTITRWIEYAVAVAPFDPAQGFTIIDETAGESLEFPPQSQASIWLGSWDPKPEPLMLLIPASRWDHKLELHTATGESFEVDKGMMQGFWSLDAQGQSWFHSYYYLDATTQKRPGVDWWVYDTETHDRSPVNQADLSGWAAPDADVDSDGDGIPDWWETAWGLDPGKPADIAQDSDEDGLPDWWELYWGLNPYDRDQNKNGITDGDDDFDGDSRSNEFEYQNRGNSPGEDPGRPPEDEDSPPRAPTHLDLVPELGEGKVILTWADRSSNETGFVIEGFKRFEETPGAPVYRWTAIKTVAKNARAFAIKSPESFSRYRVYAENLAGRSRPTREMSVDLIHVGVDGNSSMQQEGAKVDVKLEIDGVIKNITAAEIREIYQEYPDMDPDDMDPPESVFRWSEFGESISVFRKRGETYNFKWELDVTGYRESHVSGSARGEGASEVSQTTDPEGHPDPDSIGTYEYKGHGPVALYDAVLRIYDPGTIGTPGPEVTEAAQDGTRYYLLRPNTDHDEDPTGASADCDNTVISSQDDDLVTVGMYFAPGAFSDGTVTLRVPSGVRLFVRNTQSETEDYIPLVVPAATNVINLDCANPAGSPLEPLLSATPSNPFVIYLEGTWTAQAGKLALEYRKKDEPITNAPWISSEVVLLPVELRDIKGDGDADDQVIESMQPVPTQDQGESNQAFWRRRNAYFQQQVPERSIAYIEPHRAANNSPDMPRLIARLLGGPAGVKVKWRLEVEYLRGNGYRANYVEDFTRPEDKVLIPPAGQGFTAEMGANQEWRIFETQEWLNEIQQRGFFGGTGKLYLWFTGQSQTAPTEPIITFRIGGRNPDQQLARNFIGQSAGAQFGYAYAIARHETFGRVRENGQIRFYNQFYTEYQGGPIGDASVDMGWAAWAKGWPLYNLDRGRRPNGTRYQNGPGGYGMYQLTWGPKNPNDPQGSGANAFIPRRMIWNWQDNANGAITELQGKVPAAEALRDGLQAAYPQWPALPNEGHLSGLESIVVTFYNGTRGLPSRRINGANRRTPWTAEKTGQTRTWRFHQNSQNYVQSVNARINNTMP